MPANLPITASMLSIGRTAGSTNVAHVNDVANLLDGNASTKVDLYTTNALNGSEFIIVDFGQLVVVSAMQITEVTMFLNQIRAGTVLPTSPSTGSEAYTISNPSIGPPAGSLLNAIPTSTPVRYLAISMIQPGQPSSNSTGSISGISITAEPLPPLAFGTYTITGGAGQIDIAENTAPSGGTAPYTKSIGYRVNGSGSAFTYVPYATTLALPAGIWDVKVRTVDANNATVFTNPVTVTVTPLPSPSIDLGDSALFPMLLPRKMSVKRKLKINRDGITGPITLSASSVPAGVTVTFAPATIATGSDTSEMTVTCADATVLGADDFIIDTTW
jgi:hypothetical protein